MKRTSLFASTALAALFVAVGAWTLSPSAYAALPTQPSVAQPDDFVQKLVEDKLNKKQFRTVKASVSSGVVTLSGSVDLYAHKADAEKRMKHIKGVTTVQNQIAVAGPAVADEQLQVKLAKDLAYDRVGYWNVFNAIGVRVENGTATLSGRARTDVDKDSAQILVAYTPGVKNLIDTVEVDPVSMMDDRTRFAVVRAVYGYSTLNRYALDPAKPIRISVQNGHVELYGIVDTKADSDIAFLRANGVPGVFSVTNFLAVANAPAARR
jgi:osmotically-inducible protein OsmY